MKQEYKLEYLKVVLRFLGILAIILLPTMMWLWPAGWAWTPRQPEYEQMIMAIYATLGVFLLKAAKDPMAHASLIWFAIWSSIVHGGVMLVQAMEDQTERTHFLGDIPTLFIVAIVLWYLMPKKYVK